MKLNDSFAGKRKKRNTQRFKIIRCKITDGEINRNTMFETARWFPAKMLSSRFDRQRATVSPAAMWFGLKSINPAERVLCVALPGKVNVQRSPRGLFLAFQLKWNARLRVRSSSATGFPRSCTLDDSARTWTLRSSRLPRIVIATTFDPFVAKNRVLRRRCSCRPIERHKVRYKRGKFCFF